jgi:uncharacterized protein Yka (UPF0111/DUF47 family)
MSDFKTKFDELNKQSSVVIADFKNYLTPNNPQDLSSTLTAEIMNYNNDIETLKKSVNTSNTELNQSTKTIESEIDKLQSKISKYGIADYPNTYTKNAYYNTAITSNFDNTIIYQILYYKNIFFICMIIFLFIMIWKVV